MDSNTEKPQRKHPHRKSALTNVERPVQQPEELKEAKQREVEQSQNPYPHTLRETERGR